MVRHYLQKKKQVMSACFIVIESQRKLLKYFMLDFVKNQNLTFVNFSVDFAVK